MAKITITRNSVGILLTLEDERAGKAYLTLTDDERINLAFALLEINQ